VEVPGRAAGARWCPALLTRTAGTAGNAPGVELYFTESSACWHCEAPECEAYVKKVGTLGRWAAGADAGAGAGGGNGGGDRGGGGSGGEGGGGVGGGCRGKGGSGGKGGGGASERQRRRLLRVFSGAAGAGVEASSKPRPPTRPQHMRPVWRPGGTIRVATIWGGGSGGGSGRGSGGGGWGEVGRDGYCSPHHRNYRRFTKMFEG